MHGHLMWSPGTDQDDVPVAVPSVSALVTTKPTASTMAENARYTLPGLESVFAFLTSISYGSRQRNGRITDAIDCGRSSASLLRYCRDAVGPRSKGPCTPQRPSCSDGHPRGHQMSELKV